MTPDYVSMSVDALPPRVELGDIKPDTLAPIVSELLRSPSVHSAAHRRLQDRVLDLTLRTARTELAHYRKTIPYSDVPWTYSTLESIPPITRSQIVEHREALISGATTFGFISFTSGTTGGEPLMVERSMEEARYVQEFFRNYHEL